MLARIAAITGLTHLQISILIRLPEPYTVLAREFEGEWSDIKPILGVHCRILPAVEVLVESKQGTNSDL